MPTPDHRSIGVFTARKTSSRTHTYKITLSKNQRNKKHLTFAPTVPFQCAFFPRFAWLNSNESIKIVNLQLNGHRSFWFDWLLCNIPFREIFGFFSLIKFGLLWRTHNDKVRFLLVDLLFCSGLKCWGSQTQQTTKQFNKVISMSFRILKTIGLNRQEKSI